jgi:hypothetical protein
VGIGAEVAGSKALFFLKGVLVAGMLLIPLVQREGLNSLSSLVPRLFSFLLKNTLESEERGAVVNAVAQFL